MSEDVEYTFVKGQGWVPKKKPTIKHSFPFELKSPAGWANDYINYIQLEPELEVVTHRDLRGGVYEEYRRRNPRYTFEEFRQRIVGDTRPNGDLHLRYGLYGGGELNFIVELTRHNYVNNINLTRALEQMYREAERIGF